MEMKLNSYERNDLVRTLDYAIEKRKEDYKNGKINQERMKLEIETIKFLKSKIPYDYFNRSNILMKDL